MNFLDAAATHLANGGCVAIPTETVYGLAARIDRPEGIKAIFKIKERPTFDPLIVHVSHIDELKNVVSEWSPLAAKLAAKFWPGPLTMVLAKHPSLDAMITSGLSTVAVRMPAHSMALDLIKKSGPLAAPSANRFGHTSPTTIEHVAHEFPESVSRKEVLLLDGGPCTVGIESTVCRVAEGGVEILRPGGVTAEQLKSAGAAVTELKHDKASPGHMLHHYMPVKPLIVGWNVDFADLFSLLEKSKWSEFGVQSLSDITQIELSDDARIAARMLYSELRSGDAKPGRVLFLNRNLDQGGADDMSLWHAIDDRLKRAARFQLER